jgi:hypothetical protein
MKQEEIKAPERSNMGKIIATMIGDSPLLFCPCCACPLIETSKNIYPKGSVRLDCNACDIHLIGMDWTQGNRRLYEIGRVLHGS